MTVCTMCDLSLGSVAKAEVRDTTRMTWDLLKLAAKVGFVQAVGAATVSHEVRTLSY